MLAKDVAIGESINRMPQHGRSFGTILFAMFLLLSCGAYGFQVGDLYYSEPDGGNRVSVTGCSLDSPQSITIPESVMYAYTKKEWDTNGRELLVTNNIFCTVTKVADNAFIDKETLKAVSLPRSLTRIGSSAFESCTSLTNVTFNGCVPIINSYAFARCENLRHISIPDAVSDIRDSAFADSGLCEVRLPDSLTIISYQSFWSCDNLTNVIIGGNVECIEEEAFAWCRSLHEIKMSEGVKSIGQFAFAYCGIAKFYHEHGQMEFGDYELSSVTIPNSVTNIGNEAFQDCWFLTNVVIGTGMLEIGYSAFAGCPDALFDTNSIPGCSLVDGWVMEGLSAGRSVSLASGIRGIASFAFYIDIESIRIPATVKGISHHAFWNCTSLTNIVFDGDSPAIGEGCFLDVNQSCTAYVKRGSKGWGVEIPGTWNGIRIEYSSADPDPIPELPNVATAAEIASALSGATDGDLTANITTKAEYDAFRQWALSVKDTVGMAAGAQAVKDSPQAWLSYALGADRLLPEVLTSDDVKVESFTPTAENGSFAFEVSIADVGIGCGVTITDSNRGLIIENLKKVLGVDGAATLSRGTFSSDNIEIAFDAPVDGKARFTATPPSNAGNSFFMRVKVK